MQGGTLRGIGVTSPSERTDAGPVAARRCHAGLRGDDLVRTAGAANTPEPVVNRIYTATQKILSTPAVRERLASLGMVVSTMPPAEFGAFIATEITRWTADAKAAGIEAK